MGSSYVKMYAKYIGISMCNLKYLFGFARRIWHRDLILAEHCLFANHLCVHFVLMALLQTLLNCRTEVCKVLGMAEFQCELSMGMSNDFEQAVS